MIIRPMCPLTKWSLASVAALVLACAISVVVAENGAEPSRGDNESASQNITRLAQAFMVHQQKLQGQRVAGVRTWRNRLTAWTEDELLIFEPVLHTWHCLKGTGAFEGNKLLTVLPTEGGLYVFSTGCLYLVTGDLTVRKYVPLDVPVGAFVEGVSLPAEGLIFFYGAKGRKSWHRVLAASLVNGNTVTHEMPGEVKTICRLGETVLVGCDYPNGAFVYDRKNSRFSRLTVAWTSPCDGMRQSLRSVTWAWAYPDAERVLVSGWGSSDGLSTIVIDITNMKARTIEGCYAASWEKRSTFPLDAPASFAVDRGDTIYVATPGTAAGGSIFVYEIEHGDVRRTISVAQAFQAAGPAAVGAEAYRTRTPPLRATLGFGEKVHILIPVGIAASPEEVLIGTNIGVFHVRLEDFSISVLRDLSGTRATSIAYLPFTGSFWIGTEDGLWQLTKVGGASDRSSLRVGRAATETEEAKVLSSARLALKALGRGVPGAGRVHLSESDAYGGANWIVEFPDERAFTVLDGSSMGLLCFSGPTGNASLPAGDTLAISERDILDRAAKILSDGLGLVSQQTATLRGPKMTRQAKFAHLVWEQVVQGFPVVNGSVEMTYDLRDASLVFVRVSLAKSEQLKVPKREAEYRETRAVTERFLSARFPEYELKQSHHLRAYVQPNAFWTEGTVRAYSQLWRLCDIFIYALAENPQKALIVYVDVETMAVVGGASIGMR